MPTSRRPSAAPTEGEATPVRVLKKYPNRRLYDTATSSYITLAEVRQLVMDKAPFVVRDAKSGGDLTRSILLQIILEEESGGVPMFSAAMLSNIIRYYGHSMQGLMGNYLERSIGAFHEAQKKFQEQTKSLYGNIGAGAGNTIPPFGSETLTKLMQANPGVVPNPGQTRPGEHPAHPSAPPAGPPTRPPAR